jgi:LysM repeat protein
VEKERKTRSNGKKSYRIFFGFLAILLSITLTGCNNDYVSLDDIQNPTLQVVQVQPTDHPIIAVLPTEPAPTLIALAPGIGGGMELNDLQATEIPIISETEVVTETPLFDPNLEFPTATPELDVTTEPSASPEEPISTSAQPSKTSVPPLLYYTQAGDTLPAIAIRFKVKAKDIISAEQLSATGFLDPNVLLMIPPTLNNTSNNLKLIPDSEIVFSPSALDFDIDGFVVDGGGYLSTYREYLNSTGWISGSGIIRKVAIENSISPRLLLSLLQFKSGWVYGQPINQKDIDYPLGHVAQFKKGLYSQLTWAVSQLSFSYYGWREGIMTDIPFMDGTILRAAPDLNAGTYAVQYLFAQMYGSKDWENALYGTDNFAMVHERILGNPWLRAVAVEPLFPATLQQPNLILPFEQGVKWALTGGPHSAWGAQGARAALDFAPAGTSGCSESNDWVLAAASGVVARTGGGVVVLDLDGDGNEQTGWNLFYMHIATKDLPVVGQWLEQGDKLGHASCEGGVSTGTHFHIARKYNGEWILAGGPLPINLDGWIAHAAPEAYKGTLTRNGKVVTACTCATANTNIYRDVKELE